MNLSDASFARHHQMRISHWDAVAASSQGWSGWGWAYHQRLAQIYRSLVPPRQRVLEIGCAQGHLLAALQPACGVGVDFSRTMVRDAARRYPYLYFVCADGHALPLQEPFDIIILSDLVNDVWDVQTIFEQVRRVSTPHTRIILNVYSRLWEQPLELVKRLGLAKPTLHQNWLTVEDIDGLFHLTNLELIRHLQEILWPLPTPLIDTLANCSLVKLWPFSLLALTNILVARPYPEPRAASEHYRVSVVVPARNEAGNIPRIFERTPEMGQGTELIFVEGHSRDETAAAIEQAIQEHPQRQSMLLFQRGKGKGDAVRLGFAHATGDVLMILDADMTVPPEDLPRFYEALRSGKGEFINGVRLVYPMEQEAMRFFNLLGNKFFSLAFSWLLDQPIKDTLCGTKVLWRSEYEQIAANRYSFGDFDPFGDFDLLFGAARLNLKIIDLPIRYRERTYGATNIERWKHGWLLLRMVVFAARRIKFV